MSGNDAEATSAPQDRSRLDNIFLVGLMGAGKTSVGRLLARRFSKDFCDCDQEIERATGATIPLIFEIEGESGFRARETKVLARLAHRRNIVLATGGGAVLSEDNRRLLSDSGVIVYLRASASELLNRTRHDKNRPLLQTSNPLAKLEQLFAERDPLYRSIADIIVDSGNQSVGNLARRVEHQLRALHAAACAGEGTSLRTG